MKIKIKVSNAKIYEIDCESNESIENVKALIEVETGNPLPLQKLIFKNKTLKDEETLDKLGIKENDTIELQTLQNQAQQPQQLLPLNFPFLNAAPLDPLQNPALLAQVHALKEQYQNNPDQLNFILHQNPEFAEAVLNDDNSVLAQYIYLNNLKLKEKEMKEMKRIQQLNDDPLNPEYQKQIFENIQQEQVNEQFEFAQEYLPESFGQVTMLYIEAKINKYSIQAFVDSGAQMTIISQDCAERCGLMRLVDKRFRGKAVGVGFGDILGRIHAVNLQIGDKFVNCSLSVLAYSKTEFLLGLDMLKRHQCMIDLAKGVLRFNNDEFSIQFLAEKDIKKSLSSSQMLKDEEDEEFKQAQENSKKDMQKINEENNKQQQQQQQQSGKQNQNQTQASPFPEESISKLMEFGCSRSEAINLLMQCSGNLEIAISMLF